MNWNALALTGQGKGKKCDRPLEECSSPSHYAIISIHLRRISTYPCFILYTVSKWDQTNDIDVISGLSAYAVST